MHVRPVDFHGLDRVSAEIADESGCVGAGGLHADHRELAELLEPREQGSLTARVGREGAGAQQPTAVIERGGVMGIGVRVDAAGDTPV